MAEKKVVDSKVNEKNLKKFLEIKAELQTAIRLERNTRLALGVRNLPPKKQKLYAPVLMKAHLDVFKLSEKFQKASQKLSLTDLAIYGGIH